MFTDSRLDIAFTSGAVATALLASAFVAFPAHAAEDRILVAYQTTGSLALDANANLGVSASGTTGSSGSASTGADAASGSTGSGASDMDNDDSNNGAGSSASANGSADAGISIGSFSLSRSDLKEDASSISSAVSAEFVKDRDALSAYVRSGMQNDENIQSVETEDDSVTMEYRRPGRLFGFIPVTMTERATVNADGSVKVSYPWYRFLVSTEAKTADLETDLQSRVSAWRARMENASSSFSASARASIIGEMMSAFRGGEHMDASVNGSASGNASTTSGASDADGSSANS
jgi:hypothetical protein